MAAQTARKSEATSRSGSLSTSYADGNPTGISRTPYKPGTAFALAAKLLSVGALAQIPHDGVVVRICRTVHEISGPARDTVAIRFSQLPQSREDGGWVYTE
jgi:hypothetical protein